MAANMADTVKNRENAPGRIVDGVWQPWGGGCRCRSCLNKVPRQGFYKAPRADYERDAREDWTPRYVPGQADENHGKAEA